MTSREAQNPAQVYDQYFGPAMFIPSSKPLLEHAGPVAGQRAIDLACGSGIVTELIADAVGSDGSVVGLDFSPPMLEVARSKQISAAPIEWVESDAAAIPFPDASFDLAVLPARRSVFPGPAGVCDRGETDLEARWTVCVHCVGGCQRASTPGSFVQINL